MKEYNIWFQNTHIMMVIRAENHQKARRIFNKSINIKQIKINSLEPKEEEA